MKEEVLNNLDEAIRRFSKEHICSISRIRHPSNELRCLVLMFLGIVRSDFDEEFIESLNQMKSILSTSEDYEWAAICDYFTPELEGLCLLRSLPETIIEKRLNLENMREFSASFIWFLDELNFASLFSHKDYRLIGLFIGLILEIFEAERIFNSNVFLDQHVTPPATNRGALPLCEISHFDPNVSPPRAQKLGEKKQMRRGRAMRSLNRLITMSLDLRPSN